MQLHDITKLYNQGYSINRLGCMLGIHNSKVRQILVDNGIEIRGKTEGMKAYRQQTNKELERENRI